MTAPKKKHATPNPQPDRYEPNLHQREATAQERLVPVRFIIFKEPQRLPGSQSCSSLSSYAEDHKTSRHTIDWVPAQQQFRIVFHPPNKATETRWTFPASVSNYRRFDRGDNYVVPPQSGIPQPKHEPQAA